MEINAQLFGQMETAFDCALFGMAVLSLPDYRVVRVNAALADMLGQNQDRLQGSPLLVMIIGDQPGVSLEMLVGDEFPVILPNAVAQWVRVSIAVGDDNALAIVEDISERKAVEAQLIHGDRLAQLGGLTASLLHDLTQPMNIMRLTSENALDRLEDGERGPEEIQRQMRSLSVVLDQLRRVQDIFDQTWAFSSPGDGPAVEFDAREVVARAIDRVVVKPCAARAKLIWDPPETPVLLFGRGDRLELILVQLLTNSCEALMSAHSMASNPSGVGRVEVQCRNDPEREVVILSVIDDGPGVSPAVGERLFRPTLSARPLGKGLGLPVSLGIAAELGGSIEQVKNGRGARFDILLPALAAGCEQTPDKEEEKR